MADDLVVIPTYNEAPNITGLLESVLALGPFTVLVVDDNSPDGTGQIADMLAEIHRNRLVVIHRGGRPGLGDAYRAGFTAALATGADRIYQMDADFSHNPARLLDMRRVLIEDAELVIGSRYASGGRVSGWPWWRRVLSLGGSWYSRAMLDLDYRDLTSGFKGWRRGTLESIRVGATKSNGYAFQVETTYRAHLAGARVIEIPIHFIDRELGMSKMGWPIVFEAARVVPNLRSAPPKVSPVETRGESRARPA